MQLLFDTKNRQADGRPKLQIATLKVNQSKKHRDRIREQKARDAKAAQHVELLSGVATE